MSHIANDVWYENRREFLGQHGKAEKDVLTDEKGVEYILPTSGVCFYRVDLPKMLQTNYEPDTKQD